MILLFAGKINYFLLSIAMLSFTIVLLFAKVIPHYYSQIIVTAGIVSLFLFLFFLYVLCKLTERLTENNVAPEVCNQEANPLLKYTKDVVLRLQAENFLPTGIVLGIAMAIIGESGDRFYPNDFFYWSNSGVIIVLITFSIFLFQLSILTDYELLRFKEYFEKGSNSYQPFRLGWRDNGFRLSGIEIVCFLACFLLTPFLYISSSNAICTVISCFPIIIAFHYFLFENLFRIRHVYVFCWSVIFFFNIFVRLFWSSMFGYLNGAAGFWQAVLLLQLPITLALVAIALTDRRYQGIYSHYLSCALVQPISSAPKPQVSDAISGEKPESDQVDTKQSTDEPIEKRQNLLRK